MSNPKYNKQKKQQATRRIVITIVAVVVTISMILSLAAPFFMSGY